MLARLQPMISPFSPSCWAISSGHIRSLRGSCSFYFDFPLPGSLGNIIPRGRALNKIGCGRGDVNELNCGGILYQIITFHYKCVNHAMA